MSMKNSSCVEVMSSLVIIYVDLLLLRSLIFSGVSSVSVVMVFLEVVGVSAIFFLFTLYVDG